MGEWRWENGDGKMEMGKWRWENGDGKRKIKKDIMLHSNFQFSTFNFQLKKGFRPFFNTIVYCSESDSFAPTSNPAGYWHWH